MLYLIFVCLCVCVFVCPFGEQMTIIEENLDLEGREQKNRNFDHQLI